MVELHISAQEATFQGPTDGDPRDQPLKTRSFRRSRLRAMALARPILARRSWQRQ